tara:strand:+ start:326 stop:721 length:396 start_codon:yes stop_codon:yes gene_type:complete
MSARQRDDELEDVVFETEKLYRAFLFQLNEPNSDLSAIQSAFRDFMVAKRHICHHLDERIKRNTEFKNQLTEFPGFPVVQHIVSNIREQLPELERIIETDQRRLNNFKSSAADGQKQFDEYLQQWNPNLRW